MPETYMFISEADRQAAESELSRVIEEGFDGIELVEVRYYKQYGAPTVELLIWKKGGIDLNDCEAVHNAVSEVLDGFEKAFPDAYTLNVSSLGLDRKIVADGDFRRALGTEIECVTNDRKKVHGVLEEYDSEKVVLSVGTQKKTVLRNNLTKVQPYVRF